MAAATRVRKSAAEKRAEMANALRNSRQTFYTVIAFDEDGFAIAVSDGEMTFENAECARAFMRAEFRPARVTVTDEYGYDY